MNAYSKDLRLRVLEAVDRGLPRGEVSDLFGVSRSTIKLMDNLQVHKMKRVRELIERRGCELVFLPSYSPDFNPIEEAFSKVKTLLRKAKARSFETLAEASGRALCAVGRQGARGYFDHCGYRALQDHSL